MWLDRLGVLMSKVGLAGRGVRRGPGRDPPSIPRHVAFVHVMKTAGTFVDTYLRSRVLARRGYHIDNSWPHGRQSDWTAEELEGFRAVDAGTALYVHNNVGNWPDDIVRRYLDDGWFASPS